MHIKNIVRMTGSASGLIHVGWAAGSERGLGITVSLDTSLEVRDLLYEKTVAEAPANYFATGDYVWVRGLYQDSANLDLVVVC